MTDPLTLARSRFPLVVDQSTSGDAAGAPESRRLILRGALIVLPAIPGVHNLPLPGVCRKGATAHIRMTNRRSVRIYSRPRVGRPFGVGRCGDLYDQPCAWPF
jgi:hypothetical protein